MQLSWIPDPEPKRKVINIDRVPHIDTIVKHAWGACHNAKKLSDSALVKAWTYSHTVEAMRRMNKEPRGYVSSRHHHICPQISDPGRIELINDEMSNRGLLSSYELSISFGGHADQVPLNTNPELNSYDVFIVAFSGGKDSIACLCHLLDQGVDRSKIELWHHEIDGREGSKLMDWPVTADYCRQIARAFNLPIYFSWKEGGFEREMNRHNAPTAPTWFETPDGLMTSGGKGPDGTRLKFPQVSANLSVRWCSAYLKIDVGSSAIRNQSRFKGARTLFVSGERAEESPSRAKYATFEPHRTNGGGRHVDHWRPIHGWQEAMVWDIIKRYKINPHPAYRLGWSRLSCAACIFGGINQWASHQIALPDQFGQIKGYEKSFGVTIHRTEDVSDRAEKGTAYEMEPDILELARSDIFYEPIFIENWALPAGAFGENAGPS